MVDAVKVHWVCRLRVFCCVVADVVHPGLQSVRVLLINQIPRQFADEVRPGGIVVDGRLVWYASDLSAQLGVDPFLEAGNLLFLRLPGPMEQVVKLRLPFLRRFPCQLFLSSSLLRVIWAESTRIYRLSSAVLKSFAVFHVHFVGSSGFSVTVFSPSLMNSKAVPPRGPQMYISLLLAVGKWAASWRRTASTFAAHVSYFCCFFSAESWPAVKVSGSVVLRRGVCVWCGAALRLFIPAAWVRSAIFLSFSVSCAAVLCTRSS